MAIIEVSELWRRFRASLPKKIASKYCSVRGLTPSKIREAELDLGHALPDDVREFYGISNGIPHIEIVIEPGRNIGYMLPLAPLKERSVLASFQTVRTVHRGYLEWKLKGTMPSEARTNNNRIVNQYWAPGWLPLFDNIQGDYLMCDMQPKQLRFVGQILDVTRMDGAVGVVAPSFSSLLASVVKILEDDGFEIADQGTMVSIERKPSDAGLG